MRIRTLPPAFGSCEDLLSFSDSDADTGIETCLQHRSSPVGSPGGDSDTSIKKHDSQRNSIATYRGPKPPLQSADAPLTDPRLASVPSPRCVTTPHQQSWLAAKLSYLSFTPSKTGLINVQVSRLVVAALKHSRKGEFEPALRLLQGARASSERAGLTFGQALGRVDALTQCLADSKDQWDLVSLLLDWADQQSYTQCYPSILLLLKRLGTQCRRSMMLSDDTEARQILRRMSWIFDYLNEHMSWMNISLGDFVVPERGLNVHKAHLLMLQFAHQKRCRKTRSFLLEHCRTTGKLYWQTELNEILSSAHVKGLACVSTALQELQERAAAEDGFDWLETLGRSYGYLARFMDLLARPQGSANSSRSANEVTEVTTTNTFLQSHNDWHVAAVILGLRLDDLYVAKGSHDNYDRQVIFRFDGLALLLAADAGHFPQVTPDGRICLTPEATQAVFAISNHSHWWRYLAQSLAFDQEHETAVGVVAEALESDSARRGLALDYLCALKQRQAAPLNYLRLTFAPQVAKHLPCDLCDWIERSATAD